MEAPDIGIFLPRGLPLLLGRSYGADGLKSFWISAESKTELPFEKASPYLIYFCSCRASHGEYDVLSDVSLPLKDPEF